MRSWGKRTPTSVYNVVCDSPSSRFAELKGVATPSQAENLGHVESERGPPREAFENIRATT